MVRKTTAVTEEIEETQEHVADAMSDEASLQEKLDVIIAYMHRMERRDRWRTTGGFFRGLLGIIPIALLVWSAWYFYAHGTEFMEQITKEAVRQSAEYSQGSLMEQLEQYMNEPQQ